MIVPYEIAVKLKQLGFSKECPDIYWLDGDFEENYGTFDWNNQSDEDCISAPSISDALQWIRDKYLICWVQFDYIDGVNYYGTLIQNDSQMTPLHTDCFESFPEAESALLDLVLTYLE